MFPTLSKNMVFCISVGKFFGPNPGGSLPMIFHSLYQHSSHFYYLCDHSTIGVKTPPQSKSSAVFKNLFASCLIWFFDLDMPPSVLILGILNVLFEFLIMPTQLNCTAPFSSSDFKLGPQPRSSFNFPRSVKYFAEKYKETCLNFVAFIIFSLNLELVLFWENLHVEELIIPCAL